MYVFTAECVSARAKLLVCAFVSVKTCVCLIVNKSASYFCTFEQKHTARNQYSFGRRWRL